ncbi:MAG: XdhC family protein [Actinomycetota bacterium]
MKDVLEELEGWLAQGKRAALATLIATERSAPRDPGAVLAISEDGKVMGSVSGGCVEPAIIEEAMGIIESGQPKRLTYGITDEEACAVGLTCGGTVHLIVERLLPAPGEVFTILSKALKEDAPVALVTEVRGPQPGAKILVAEDEILGSLGDAGLDEAVVDQARAMLEMATTGTRYFGPKGEARLDDVEVFVHSFAQPPDMYVFGAVNLAAAVVRIGKFLGYKVTVCDARKVFANRDRFPEADEIVVKWPDDFLADAPVDRRSAICILTHDPKFDIPLLKIALKTPAAYIGAMGSRRTHERRRATLVEEGVPEEDLVRIQAPIGLDIGARIPEEVAVSIAAQIIALRYQRSGGFLKGGAGTIHAEPTEKALT